MTSRAAREKCPSSAGRATPGGLLYYHYYHCHYYYHYHYYYYYYCYYYYYFGKVSYYRRESLLVKDVPARPVAPPRVGDYDHEVVTQGKRVYEICSLVPSKYPHVKYIKEMVNLQVQQTKQMLAKMSQLGRSRRPGWE